VIPFSLKGDATMSLTIERTSTYTLAQHTPLLQGKQLCDFLDTMDREEQQLLAQEQGQATTRVNSFDEQNRFQEVVGKIIGLAGAGTFVTACSVMSFRNDEGTALDTLFKTACVVGMVGALSGLAITGGVSKERSTLTNELNSSTEDARLLRLQFKVRQLESFITQCPYEAQKEQVEMARDYFKLRETQMMHSKINTIEVRYK
jgi:hypothetical protein